METVYLYFWLFLFAIGGLSSIYMWRIDRKAAGLFMVVSTITASTIGVATSYYGFNEAWFQSVWVAWLFSQAGTAYLLLRTSRAFVFLALPLFFLVHTFIVPLEPFMLLAIMAFMLGILAAYDYSKRNMAEFAKSGSRSTKILLGVFYTFERIVRAKVRGRWLRPLLFLFYSLVSTILVVVPLLAYKVSGSTILTLLMSLGSLVFLSQGMQECSKGPARLGKE